MKSWREMGQSNLLRLGFCFINSIQVARDCARRVLKKVNGKFRSVIIIITVFKNLHNLIRNT